MLDPATLVILGTGSSSLFIALIEYLYSRKKRLQIEDLKNKPAESFQSVGFLNGK